ncbi:hypothetical protein Ddye_016836 [Dipteronia dyeriana]|uniref:Uncharacterized protein n=1 Tax=Dipteronia dyeriana TaxID=168575 RepID=A0AAD9U8E5_9ROSI|nr:hypothetical protein Ddye_016836 [Dipteronia dyeriana]
METNTIDWPPERWEEYIKKYPDAKQFRNRPLPNHADFKALFSGVTATGVDN